MPSGFSSTVARFFRAFQRHDHGDPADGDTTASSMTSCSSSSSSLLTAAAGRAPPKQTRLPSNFTRHVRQLVDYVSLVAKLRAATPPASASSTARRHAAAAKALDRIAQTLKARDSNDQSGTRTVPLNVALEQLLTVWECVLQCLDLSRTVAASDEGVRAPSPTERLSTTSSMSSSSSDDGTRLESAARRLLALLIQQREFDIALMALGRGECNVHQNDGTRKRSIVVQDGSLRLDELRVSMRQSRRNSMNLKRTPAPRPLPSKRDVSKTSDAPLCVLSKKYLDLHQTTLRLLQDVHSASGDRLESRHERQGTSDRALLLQLLAASYMRVPALRDAMLMGFQLFVGKSKGRRHKLQAREQRRQRSTSKAHAMAAFARNRSVTLQDEVNVALFRWTQSLSSKCHASVAPYNREGYWTKETRHLTSAMRSDVKFQRVLLAQLMDHFLTVGGTAGIDWKCLPGATTLKEALLTMTESVYTSQIKAAEQALREKQDASTGGDHGEGSALKSETEQSFSLSTPDDWTIGLFLQQTMRVLAYNSFIIHDWMMTILHNTNALVATHVTLCLRYLSQLLTEFPAYFAEDTTSATSTVLLQIFTQLLASDHYEILRNTELFLMKHFGGFSVTLRESLVAVFAVEFKRLFLHWNRDVRFCFYHMMLYLTYPGNRLVLGATSDELLMGAEASYLFEIPGLIRHSTSAAAIQWEAFDKPLCELVTFVNRTVKQAATKKSLASSSASTQMARGRSDQPSSSTTTRMSMTMTRRSKPTARASLGTRPSQYGRASLSQSQGPLSQGRASMHAMPTAPPKSAPSALQTPPPPPPPPPAWIQALPLLTVQRSVQEYRRHVETYFAYARQISIHEPVPTPMLATASRS